MIRVSAEYGYRAIDLLREHSAHEKMRPGLRTECEAASGLNIWSGIEPVRSADQKREIARTGVTHRRQHFGKGLARHALAARIEDNNVCAFGNARRKLLALFGNAGAGFPEL